MSFEKVILITGVAGFICSHVTNYFVQKYPSNLIVGVDKLMYCSNMKGLEPVIQSPNFIFRKADITEMDQMLPIFDEFKPTILIHLAAYSHVDASFGNSIDFTKNNVLGTHILLELSRVKNVKLFLSMSTDEVYGSKDTLSYEYTILDPTNPYAATKAASEHLVRSYHHSFKLPSIIVRCNNVYGPGQHPEKVVPRFIMRLIAGKGLEIQGSGQQLRSFIHVKDVCTAIDTIYQKGIVGEIYNIGSENEMSILELAGMLLKKFGKDGGESEKSSIRHIEDRKFNDQRYHINYDKIGKLGWKQQIQFSDGMNELVEWHKQNPDFWNMEDVADLV